MANYLIMLVISYFGLIVGSIISYFAKEELGPGMKYFRILKFLVFAIIFSMFLAYMQFSYIITLPISIVISYIMLNLDTRLRYVDPEMIYFGFFSIVLSEARNASPIFATLIFLYGLPAASLKCNGKSFHQDLKVVFSATWIYLAMGALLYLVFRA